MYTLTKLGYQIPLTHENEEKCKKDLILKAKTNTFTDYGSKPTLVHNYRKSKKYLYVPRYYGI